MNPKARVAVAFVGLSIFALAAAFLFGSGLVSGEVSCFGKRCPGTVSLAAQPTAYLLSMGVYGFSAVVMGSLATFASIQLLRRDRGQD